MLSEGQGRQLLFLILLVFFVLVILLFVGWRLHMDWQTVIASFLDPGVYNGPDARHHDWFRIIIALLGVFLFSGLLITVIINIVGNVTTAYEKGENRYHFSDHILFLGSARPLVTMLDSIRKHPELSRKEILVMTSVDVVHLRSLIWNSLADKKFCRQITFYRSDRESEARLREASPDKAAMIYLIGEDNELCHDALNIQCLEYLRNICSGKGPAIQCFMSMEMHSSLDVIRYLKGGEKSRLCVDVINKSDYIVEQLLVHTDAMPALTEEAKGKYVRIVIAGYSRVGRSFATVASQICHYPNFAADTRTQITFIDTGMRQSMDFFVANHSAMFDLCHYHYLSEGSSQSFAPKEEYGDFMDLEWTFVDADPSSPFARDLIEKWASDPMEELVVAVCYEKDTKSFSTALHLPRCVYERKSPVLVYQEGNPALVFKAAETGMFGKLAVFGEGLPDYDALFLKRTTWGKRINRIYDLQYGNPPAEDADSAWKNLPYAHKLSSIASSNFMPMILRCFGLELSEEVFDALPGDVLEKISEAEHRRWMTSVLLLGYYPAGRELRKDRSAFTCLKKEKFIHLDIVPYDELAHEQDKDRMIVSKIPCILRPGDGDPFSGVDGQSVKD